MASSQGFQSRHRLVYVSTDLDDSMARCLIIHRNRFIAIGALLWGYDAQVGGGVLSIPSFRRDFGYIFQGEPVLQAKWQSAFNSVSSVGGLFGGLSVGWLADRLG